MDECLRREPLQSDRANRVATGVILILWMKLCAAAEDQCQNTFRLDRPDCRACAGHKTDCPDYRPNKKKDAKE